MINFVIPVKHTGLIASQHQHREYLDKLIDAILSQKCQNTKIWVVCPNDYEIDNENINIIRVDREKPNQELAGHDIKQYFKQVRIDKGSKIFEVYKKIEKDDWIIPLDDDDLIRNDYLTMIKKINSPFFVIKKGYKWFPSSQCLIKLNRFDEHCGTSIGFKKFLVEKYENNQDFIEILGSHNLLKIYEKNPREVVERIVLWRLENINSTQEVIMKNKNTLGKLKFYVRALIANFRDKKIINKKYELIMKSFTS